VSFRSLSILSYAWGLHHPIHANLLVPCPERDQYSCPIAPRLCKVFMGYSCYSLEFGSFYLIYDGSSPSSQLQGVTSAELTQSVRLSANGLLMALCSSMYHDRDVKSAIILCFVWVGGWQRKTSVYASSPKS